MDAVCLLENYMTALIGLEQQSGIEENDLILISVGFSGTGLAAVDLSTNVFRAQVNFAQNVRYISNLLKHNLQIFYSISRS